jgi:hypothetical protein
MLLFKREGNSPFEIYIYITTFKILKFLYYQACAYPKWKEQLNTVLYPKMVIPATAQNAMPSIS